jgi:hypothetical protein
LFEPVDTDKMALDSLRRQHRPGQQQAACYCNKETTPQYLQHIDLL